MSRNSNKSAENQLSLSSVGCRLLDKWWIQKLLIGLSLGFQFVENPAVYTWQWHSFEYGNWTHGKAQREPAWHSVVL